jgi:hypothetical protein
MKIFLALLLIAHSAHASECSTAAVLNEDSDYEACRVTLDGKDSDQNIPENTCAAYCQLRQVNKLNDSYKPKKITASANE